MNGKAPLFGRSSKKCPGAYNLHDDLRVVGANDKEHDQNLNRVMRNLEESRLTLNYDKCEIGVSSMVYMGDELSGEGLKVSSERVKAIIEAPAPQNQSEVRSFLAGLCAVLCKVHSELRNHIESIVGPHQQRRKVEVGTKRGEVISRSKRPVDTYASDGILQAKYKNPADNRRFTYWSWSDSGTGARRRELCTDQSIMLAEN